MRVKGVGHGVAAAATAEAPTANLKRAAATVAAAMKITKNEQQNEERIVKTRYVDEKSNQQILRVDEEGEVQKLEFEFTNDQYDALVISDYDKGFITQDKLIELSSRFVGPVFVDTKKNTDNHDFHYDENLNNKIESNDDENVDFQNSYRKRLEVIQQQQQQ